MNYILHIDTSTEVCSVALSESNQLLALRESCEAMSHGANLSVFIRELLAENNLKVNHLSAIAVSRGPGSYTGLRIGVSTVKGLCYGADIPLISVNTLKQLTVGLIESHRPNHEALFCPMLDARRMEVYTAVYDSGLKEIKPIEAKIIDNNSFSSLLDKHTVYFFGNGAEKCAGVIQHKNAVFVTKIAASAKNMINLSVKKYQEKRFEDIAYFEPYYLKDFIATTPKNKIPGL